MTTREHDLAPEAHQCGSSQPTGKPYGFWATLGLSLVVSVVYLMGSVAVVLAAAGFEMVGRPPAERMAMIDGIQLNGFVLLFSLVIAGLLGLAVILLLVRWRRGISLGDYLCFQGFRTRTLLAWLFAVVVFLGLYHLVARLIEPEDFGAGYMALYQSSVYPALFWLAIVVVAPVFEEVFFRGFMFRGLEASRLGAPGAILITSLIWAVIHTQYGFTVILAIFGLGIIFGLARARHRSVPLTILLHMVVNGISTAEIAIASAGP
jgi:membrane protease YdiL (CAAX protease family)